MADSSKPLVSVITPAFNAEKYIGEVVGSVFAQAYPAWEMIIVDDGSIDRTAEIIKSYATKDPRIIYHYQTNQRMASARNAGIKLAKGKYIAFLDADNLFLPNKLADQVSFMESNPECGLSYAKIHHFYDGAPSVLYENKNESPFTSGDLFRETLRRNFINVLSVLVRKDIFDRYGAFMQGWEACDEQYVWVNLSYHKVRFCYLPKAVGLLRLHYSSDSANNRYLFIASSKFLDLLNLVETWLTPEEKFKYLLDIQKLKKIWRRKLVIGKLLLNPFLAKILMPLFLFRRNQNFIPKR